MSVDEWLRRYGMGRKGVQQSAMLTRLSALQSPRLTQTAKGGKRMAIKPRKMSLPHILTLLKLCGGLLSGRRQGRQCCMPESTWLHVMWAPGTRDFVT